MKILFCFPYAGGSSSIYYRWNKMVSDSINLVPIELKGRGRRINEGFYSDLNEAVEDIYELIKGDINKNDYAFFGHSMGGRLAYKLYHEIKDKNNKKPNHIFFSGCGAPTAGFKPKSMIHDLPDNEFLERVMEMGGTSEELLYNKDLQKLYIPILRNDFKILEKDNGAESLNKIECDITVLSGDNDNTISTDIKMWENHAGGRCYHHTFNGNHFFINHYAEEITKMINKTME
ncbi:thioesterase domain-containing protein [Bacillus spizizenii]|nr:thioesterase domain-containing protein [Bacillus spizizenii]